MINMTDGTLFKRENTPGGGVFSTIAQVTNITFPKFTRKTAEVYIHDQSAPVVKTGAYEAMEAVCEIAFDADSAAHQAFLTDINAKSALNYQIVMPNTGGAVFAFNAVLTGFELGDAGAEGTDAQTATVTMSLTAAPTVTW